MKSLDEYRRKRNFQRTPEPAGPAPDAPDVEVDLEEGGSFVIHKHAATRLHYDLRLEMDGVYKSWAVPKGPSLTPGEKRLAVHVEDHPLEYGEFEGVIPEKEYGGGTVMLWDRGRWAPVHIKGKPKGDKNRIDFALLGEKLRGIWTLVRTSGRPGEKADSWLLIKRRDDAADQSSVTDLSVATGRSMKQIAAEKSRTWTREGEVTTEPKISLDPKTSTGSRKKGQPKTLQPALAALVDSAPDGEDWLHEIKFDGYRILAHFDAQAEKSATRLMSRNGKDWSRRFPEVSAMLNNLACRQAILDGEIVALASDGTSSFRQLQEALSTGDTRGLVYQVFDLVYLDGYDLSQSPLSERKKLLAALLQNSGFTGSAAIRYTDHIQGMGPAFIDQACRLGLEGIISKRADGSYRAGQRKNWFKIKCTAHEELLICGYTEPGGKRSGFGALLLAAWVGDQLVFTGKVGTGFSDRVLNQLHKRLRELEIEQPPVSAPVEEKGVHWVAPKLVAEVEFTEWTRDGALRHPTFRGLREDRDPGEIQLPEAARLAAAAGSSAPNPWRARSSKSPAVRKTKGSADVAGINLTNAGRVLYPEAGITKLQLAHFYEEIEPWIMSQIAYRPLSLVRCPEGYTKECFFQKHPRTVVTQSVPRVQIGEKEGKAPYLYVEKFSDVIALVQAGALELHVWGSRVDDVERPDILVFDLDPSPGVALAETLRVARELRDRLSDLGLESFARTTGGKGLHLVVPLVPGKGWEEAKTFCHGVASMMARDDRSRITANMAKAKRHGRIFIDYLRNGRGATAIASYSTRARAGAPVAVPVAWDELNEALQPDRYNVENLRRRLSVLRSDPWEDFDAARRPLTDNMLKAVGSTH